MKKLIIKYLYKKLTAHPKQYHFLRLLAEIIKDKKATEFVLTGIGLWIAKSYADKTLNYKYIPQYSDIFVVGNIVYIYTYRPGMWIGKSGEIINSLENYLNYTLNGEKTGNYVISLIEEKDTAFAHISRIIRVYNKYELCYNNDENHS